MVKNAVANPNHKYDVCLSFADEDREYVQAVANSLRTLGVRVFYDRYERVNLWGKDLYEHLDEVYRNSARYCVMFVSSHYAEKLWTSHERRSAQARALKENAEYILPARFDDTEIPGLSETRAWEDLRKMRPEDLADLIREKIGPQQRQNYLPPFPDLLFDSLGPKDLNEAQMIYLHGKHFVEVLTRMNDEERHIGFDVFMHGCPGDLPENIHINIDFLRRITGHTPHKIRRLLGGIQSLGWRVSYRDDNETEDLDIVECQLVVLEWHDMSVSIDSLDTNATHIVEEMITGAGQGLCEVHAAEALDRLDFSQLATSTTVVDEH